MELPPLNRTNCTPGMSLNEYDIRYDEEQITAYVNRTGESIEEYQSENGLTVPPGLIAAAYVRLIHETFHYQTGVHVSSKCRFFRPTLSGENLTIGGKVLDMFERGGNEYVTFSVEARTSEGEEVAYIEHTSIYALKPKTAV